MNENMHMAQSPYLLTAGLEILPLGLTIREKVHSQTQVPTIIIYVIWSEEILILHEPN